MNKLIVFILLLFASGSLAQTTTVTTSKTPLISNFANPGINVAHLIDYGPGNKFRDYGFVNNGYMQETYFNIGWLATTGGTQTTTNFFSNIFQATAYPANFFVGYTYEERSPSGVLNGTGTITASTANNAGVGINFTLSNALSAPATVGGSTSSDILVVRSPTGVVQNNALSCNEYFGTHTSGTCSLITSDVENANFVQSLDCNGCTVQLALDAGIGQSQNTSSTSQTRYVNFNGSYNVKIGYKNNSGCTAVNYTVAGSTTWASGTLTPSGSWQDATIPFTASENGTLTANEILTVSTTGDCHLQYFTVIESSSIPANTTALRDAAWLKIVALNPGSLRFMDTAGWCSNNTHLINSAYGLAGVCSSSQYIRSTVQPTWTYPDALNVCLAVTQVTHSVKHCWLTGGNWANDYGTLTTWLSTSGWNTTAAANGFDIEIEYGNEAWNSQANTVNIGSDGQTYGAMAAVVGNSIKTASGYNSAVDKIVYDGWAAPTQSFGSFGWAQNVLNTAGCSLSVRTYCPDYVDVANYTLNNLDSLTDVFGDEVAEVYNIMTKTGYPSAGGSFPSLKQTCAYFSSTFGVGCAEYEYQYSPLHGTTTPTQLQMNQISGSVGNGMVNYLHGLLALQQAESPIENMFAFGDEVSNSAVNSTVQTSWSCVNLMAQGPGQTSWTYDQWRPCGIFSAVGNASIASLGSNVCLSTAVGSGGPVISYPGGQGGTIDSNSALPQTFVFQFYDCPTQTRFALIAFNTNETTNEALSMSYIAGTTPSSNITKIVVGGPVNALGDNNSNNNVTNAISTPATVVYPSSTTLSTFNSDTLPAGSMTAYTWSSAGTSPTGPTFSGNVVWKGNVIIK